MTPTPTPTPRIALCVIFRDNEKTIEALLESVCRSKRPDGTLVGYAFDEYVFVDTGCTDGTKEKIARMFPAADWDLSVEQKFPAQDRGSNTFAAAPVEDAVFDARWNGRPTVTFARFDWVNDFSAARNFCFDLAQSDWRMYLDTDDTLKYAAALRPTLGKAIVDAPEIDSAMMPYLYDPTTTQWVFRLVKWSAGYRWFGMIHEYLRPPAGKGRNHARLQHFIVTHAHDPSRLMSQFERNVKIARAEHRELTEAGSTAREDLVRLGKAAHTLGEAARTVAISTGGEGRPQMHAEAEQYLTQAADLLASTNLGSMAMVALGKLYSDMGRTEAAIRAFAAAVEYDPGAEEPRACLAMTYMNAGQLDRANRALELLHAMPPQAGYSVRDDGLVQRDLPLTAAQMYIKLGNMDSAKKWVMRINRDLLIAEPRAHGVGVDITAAVSRATVFQNFREYVECLAAADEAELIQSVFDHAPKALVDLPEFHEFKAYCAKKTRHLRSWEEYLGAYNGIPAENYDPDNNVNEYTLKRGRVSALLAWGEALPKEGAPVYVLCVGPSSTIMERQFLETNPRIHLTVAEASEFVGPALERMQNDFPGRVSRHVMRHGEIDWIPDTNKFDLIYIFEVVEHLKCPVSTSLSHLSAALRPGGDLYCSTPFGPAWLTYSHVGPDAPYDFWGHVRAHTVRTFCDEVRKAHTLGGTVELTDAGSIFLAKLKRLEHPQPAAARPRKVRIFVPHAFPAFDADSLNRRHLGGSEEAVIHLSQALAAAGYPVDVFVERPPFGEHESSAGSSHLVHKDGVTYLPIDEFSLLDDGYESTIFWRCPQVANDPNFDKARGRKVLWLHDTHYGAPAETYAKFDNVLVLSDYHRRVLMEREGGNESEVGEVNAWDDVHFTDFRNGVDVASFPTGLTRDTKKAIYCSSPDRGLEVLLAVWPDVRKEVPDATLDIYYSWDLLKTRRPDLFQKFTQLVESLEGEGVRYLGGVDHQTLHTAMAQAGVLAYPCTFEEIYAITVAKAQVAGMRIASTEFAALAETVLDRRYTVFTVDLNDADKLHAYKMTLIAALTDEWREDEGLCEGIRQVDVAREAFDWATTPRLLDGVL